MRLLFAIKSLNVAGGGAERVLVDVANGMKVRGHDVQILTFDRPGQSFYNLNPSIARLDTGIGRPGEPTPRAGFIKALPRVRKMIMNARADLVIAFMHSTYVPLSMALLGSGARLLVSEHIDATHYRSRPLQRALVWLADRLALAKTVPSPPIREQHPAAFRHRVHVMPNPVDMAQFIGGTYQACIQPPVILSVGRFMQQKNHMELLQAFARLADRFPEWTLKLVGNGLLRPELEAEVDRLGLSNRVYLPGVSRHVADEYAAASIVALPSRYESFGLVAVEALASGRPLLAFDNCVGIAEMVESGVNGLLVSANGDRVAHLAQGLEKLMMDEGLRKRLGAAGPNSVRHFDLDRVLDAWEPLFLELNVTEGSN